MPEPRAPRPPGELPSAFEIELGIGARPVLFLDYDGTLTPIVAQPEDARLDPAMRAAVERAARRHPVAIVSGRDLDDVAARVGLDTLVYAGSHGFDIRGPDGLRLEHPEGLAALGELDAAEAALREGLSAVAGARVERKRFSVAAHWRHVSAGDAPRVERIVERVRGGRSGLRRSEGKRVIELRPDVAWDKGRAVLWLLRTLGRDASPWRPVYAGDDVTDEDAFRVLVGRGHGIVVAPIDRVTWASHVLPDVEAMRRFLERLGTS